MAVAEGAVETSLWNLFTAKAELVGAGVMRTTSQETAATLLHEATDDFVCTTSVARHFPRVTPRRRQPPAKRSAKAAQPGHDGAPPAADAAKPAAEVVAVAAYAVAETGSITLDEPAADRGTCFLAERLWILVKESEIVPTLDAGMERLRALVRSGSRHPLLMTGPSRTADIERVLTIGVHGPRALLIIVVGDA